MAGKKRWFDVTVTETYHETYKVLAEDMEEADSIVDELVNCGTVDPTSNSESYDRDTSADEGSAPKEGEEYWFRHDEMEDPESERYSRKAKKGKLK